MAMPLDDRHPIERESGEVFSTMSGHVLIDVLAGEGITRRPAQETVVKLTLVCDHMVATGSRVQDVALAMLILGMRLERKGLVG